MFVVIALVGKANEAPAPPLQAQAPKISQGSMPRPESGNAATVSQKPKDPYAIPDTWAGFSASERKEDKALVAQIEKMDVWKQCSEWGPETRKNVQARRMWALQASLQSRGMINGVDLGAVTRKVPEIGMTTCGAIAVMGTPNDVNRTKSAYGERVQLVWRDARVYAYTQTNTGDGNALINSVQY